MKTFKVHGKSVVVVLTKPEAVALLNHLDRPTGCIEAKAMLKAKDKIADALAEVS